MGTWKVLMKRWLTVALVMSVAMFLLNFGNVGAQPENSPWPMFHGDVRHTGLSPYDTSHVDGTIKWTFKAGGAIESSPAIGSDGTIYFGAHNNKFYAVNPDGTQKWVFNCGDPVYSPEWDVWKGIISSPAIASDGTIYFTSMPNYLFALNPDGTEKWRYPVHVFVNVWSSPVIGSDGTVYVGSESYPPAPAQQEIGGRLYAINPDGSEKWHYDSGSSGMNGSPAIGQDGTIYTAGGDWDETQQTFVSAVFAFNLDGTIKWKFRPDAVVEGSPTIDEGGTIYIGTKNGKFYAFNSDGTVKWIFQADNGISALAAIGKDKTIYIGSWDRFMYAVNPDGTEKWRFETPPYFEAISSSAAIGADGAIYFGHSIGNFYALNPDGTGKWHLSNLGPIVSSPAIGADGTVYVGSWDNKLYAFDGPPAEETYNISGHVKSAGVPVAGATVTVDGQSTTTDENGYFQISGLENNKSYNLTVSATGYSTYSGTVSVGTPDEELADINITEAEEGEAAPSEGIPIIYVIAGVAVITVVVVGLGLFLKKH